MGKWEGDRWGALALRIDDLDVPVTWARRDQAGVVEHEPEGLVIGACGDLAGTDILVGHADELLRLEALDAVEVLARALSVIIKYRGEQVDYLLVGFAEQLLELLEEFIVGRVEDALVVVAELHFGKQQELLHEVADGAARADVLAAVVRHIAHEQGDEAVAEDGGFELFFLLGRERQDGHAGVEVEGQYGEVLGLGRQGVERCPYFLEVIEGVALHADQHAVGLHRTGVGLRDEDVAHLGLLEAVGEGSQHFVLD